MPEAIEDTLHRAGSKLRTVLLWLLFSGWSLLWGTVAAVGWAADLGGLLKAGLGVLGATFAGILGYRFTARRRLKAMAQSSLVAKAKLEGLELDRETESILRLFDLAHAGVQQRLGQGSLGEIELETTVAANMDRAREHLYRLSAAEASLRRDLRTLETMRTMDPVSTAVASTRRQIEQIDREARDIVRDAQKVSERLGEVRRLLDGPSAGAETKRQLEEAVAELDATAAAYREIDATSLEAAERRVQELRKQRSLTSG